MVKKSIKLTCPVCGQIMDSEWPCGSCLAIRQGIAYFDDNGDFRMKRHHGKITPAVVTQGTSSSSKRLFPKVKEQIPKKAKEQVLKVKKEKKEKRKKKEKSMEQEFEYEESEEEIDFSLIDEW